MTYQRESFASAEKKARRFVKGIESSGAEGAKRGRGKKNKDKEETVAAPDTSLLGEFQESSSSSESEDNFQDESCDHIHTPTSVASPNPLDSAGSKVIINEETDIIPQGSQGGQSFEVPLTLFPDERVGELLTEFRNFQEVSLTNQHTLLQEIRELKTIVLRVLKEDNAIKPNDGIVWPLKTIDDFNSVETQLENAELQGKEINLLSKIGGSSKSKVVYNTLKIMFAQELSTQIRFTNKTGKIPLAKTNLCKIIKANNSYTKENEDEYVTTKNCTNNSCPEDSACKQEGDIFICVCTHYGERLKKGKTCERNTVTGSPQKNGGVGGAHVAHNSAPIHGIQIIGHSNKPLFGKISSKSSHHGSTNSSSFSSSPQVDTSTAMNLFIGISVICSFSLLLVAVCFYKRKSLSKLLRPSATKTKIELGESINGLGTGLLIPSNRLVNNPTYDTTCVDLSIQVYSPDEVKLLGQIGKGHFGKVFKGELNGDDVAVKVAKRDYTDEAMKEMETMSGFSHPNILRLIGIVKQQDSEAPWLLFEYMEHGDLANVLRSCSKQFPFNGPFHPIEQSSLQNSSEVTQNSETPRPKLNLTNESLFDIASQIAQGMSYLSSQHFVHRDLAARNCLVSVTGVVKISDFGLSRDVYTCDYYKIGGSRLLPLRWMAPESIIYGRFTLESDVWAYGVLLWEIFSWGKQPYYGHTNDEVIQLILDGVLLSPPSDCHPIICQIMEGCWKTEPKDRLKFKQISVKFTCMDPSRAAAARMRQKRDETRTDYDGYEIPIRKNNQSIDTVDYMEVLHLRDEESSA